jgi:hypothetical protein
MLVQPTAATARDDSILHNKKELLKKTSDKQTGNLVERNSLHNHDEEMKEFIRVEMNCLSQFNERKKTILIREKNLKRRFG